MSKIFVSVDAGNGYVNAVAAGKSGKIRKTAFPSVRAAAPTRVLGLGEGREVQYDYIRWQDHVYTCGADTVRISAHSIERHHGRDRYGDEFHAMLVALALAKMDVKPTDEIYLTLFMPPGLCTADKKREVSASFKHGLEIEVNDKQYTWKFADVTIHAEGLAAVLSFMLSSAGKQLQHGIFDDDVLVVDSGTYTLDIILLRDGNFDPESLETATHGNDGMFRHIIMPLLARIHAEGRDYSIVTADMVDRAIYESHYHEEGRCLLRIAGKELDLTSALTALSQKYANWIIRNIFDTEYQQLNGVKSVIVVGGGAHLIFDHLSSDALVGDKILSYKKYGQVRDVRFTEMNAIGGLRWARFQN